MCCSFQSLLSNLFCILLPSMKTIAFSAALTEDVSLNPNDKVIYNKIFTNYGNTYDGSTGEFKAPVDGIYGIYMYLLTQTGQEGWLELIHNQDYVVSVYAKQDGAYDAAGNSVMLRLKEGDILFVRARRLSKLYGRSDQAYSSWNIHLISAL
ncbi:unnamed protein product [Candidula unifasciata]|uniref:C1q domain-containing protein n=1 Tax=Candidula unifasciata TaxID=100452 RepID=A0A8S3ZRD0_9EUPU|nr:unnamed protein product [Candidula unifasciata]